ncbi:hypothetical protein [Flagellimonas eckloniae]|uniref:Endonuclease/exonuclease/phosphatase domain-containing protein n=1 Tax=Flagellimonas eckloniae TaxID=346185 RepID=A0A0Q0XC45_9FLAO|nr:hypothetical protein [Allomuricauda eckloniae]KQC28660.1 hypothetical protein AAY42_01125 [Allomuricauda eckloniae]
MIIATYNIQNIFYRDRVLIKKYREENRELWVEEFEKLMLKGMRTNEEFNRMRALSQLLGFEDSQNSPYLTMMHNSGQLFLKKNVNSGANKATHLTDWNGWIKLNSKPINEVAVKNKAKVIKEVSPDILILLEVEDRASLFEFNKYFLSNSYAHVLYLETNDFYGRGIGVLTKVGYQVKSMKSHVNDFDENGNPIFDMDLQEYKISTPSGAIVSVLSTCFLDDSMNSGQTNTKIEIQSQRIAEIYEELSESNNLIVVTGTLNLPSYSHHLSALTEGTDLKDISKHRFFEVDLDKGKDSDYYRLGAYKMGVNIKQRDYLMLSTKLFRSVKNCGLVRKGIWFKKRPQWNILKSIKNETHMASEHPLVWSQLKIG